MNVRVVIHGYTCSGWISRATGTLLSSERVIEELPAKLRRPEARRESGLELRAGDTASHRCSRRDPDQKSASRKCGGDSLTMSITPPAGPPRTAVTRSTCGDAADSTSTIAAPILHMSGMIAGFADVMSTAGLERHQCSRTGCCWSSQDSVMSASCARSAHPLVTMCATWRPTAPPRPTPACHPASHSTCSHVQRQAEGSPCFPVTPFARCVPRPRPSANRCRD